MDPCLKRFQDRLLPILRKRLAENKHSKSVEAGKEYVRKMTQQENIQVIKDRLDAMGRY